jgi:hypothetical protein
MRKASSNGNQSPAEMGPRAAWPWRRLALQAALGLGALVLGLGAWRGSAGTAMR